MTTKQPTQRGISALLGRAGFERSISKASRIRGWRNHTPGYAVIDGIDAGTVEVRHRTFSHQPLPSEQRHIAGMLAEYATVIEAAGFAVEHRNVRLLVTARKPAETPDETGDPA